MTVHYHTFDDHAIHDRIPAVSLKILDEIITSSTLKLRDDLRSKINNASKGNAVYSSKQIKLEKINKVEVRYSIILNELKNKLDRFADYLPNLNYKSFNFINLAIINTSSNIVFEDADVEITPDNSLFFNLLISDTRKITLEFFLNDINASAKNTYFAIKENKKVIDSGIGEINDVFNYLKEV